MKKVILPIIMLVLLATGPVSADDTISGKVSNDLERYSNSAMKDKLLVWVFFSDKGENNDLRKFSSSPEAILSSRSLMRRSKVSSSNVIDITDMPVSTSYLEELKSKGFELKRVSKWLNAASGYISREAISEIAALGFVENIDLVHAFKKDFSKEDIEYTEKGTSLQKRGLFSIDYGQSYTQVAQISVPELHDMGYNGEGIVIGVFDSGFDNLEHEAFAGMNIIAAYDFVNNDNNVDNQNDMGEGSHGTGTLSTIGGFKPGALVGPAYKASYILAKTENTDSETPVEEDNWIAAMEWADSIGVDVTSTSLGYLDFDSPYTSYTWEDMNGKTARTTKVAEMAAQKGIVVVVSAGNEGSNAQHNTLGAPADAESAISVGAVDANGYRTAFSSVGPTADGRIKPDVMAMGQGVVMASSAAPGSYIRQNGTSFSCPLVAGVSALLLDVDSTLTPIQIRDILRSTASRSTNPDRFYGWGIVNAVEAVKLIKNDSTVIPFRPKEYELFQNFPNPFNSATTIRYYIPEPGNVKLELYDILGRRVAVLMDGYVNQLRNDYRLEASRFGLSSGVYFVFINTPAYKKSIKLMFVK